MTHRQTLESTKHGAAAGEPGRPESPDWTIDQGWDRYTAEDHAVWKTLFERQSKLLPGRACDEFMAGLDALNLNEGGIPDFRRMNEKLQALTGWTVVAVPHLRYQRDGAGPASPPDWALFYRPTRPLTRARFTVV